MAEISPARVVYPDNRLHVAKKTLEHSKNCDVPFAWDDPTSKEDVKFHCSGTF